MHRPPPHTHTHLHSGPPPNTQTCTAPPHPPTHAQPPTPVMCTRTHAQHAHISPSHAAHHSMRNKAPPPTHTHHAFLRPLPAYRSLPAYRPLPAYCPLPTYRPLPSCLCALLGTVRRTQQQCSCHPTPRLSLTPPLTSPPPRYDPAPLLYLTPPPPPRAHLGPRLSGDD